MNISVNRDLSCATQTIHPLFVFHGEVESVDPELVVWILSNEHGLQGATYLINFRMTFGKLKESKFI